jgi:hypothetical protein
MRSLVWSIIFGSSVGLSGCSAGTVAAPRHAHTLPPVVAATALLADGVAGPADPQKPAPLPPGHPKVPGAENQPALPPGHPKVPGADEQPPLPPGHPKVPGANDPKPGLPPGHPPMPAGQSGNVGNLPAGHPAVTPVTTAPGGKGSITIKVVQGTRGARAVGADAVGVEYYGAQGELVARSAGRVSDKGDVTVRDVPLAQPVQPLITVTHAGVAYRTPASVMDARTPEQEVEVAVYEVTDQEPAWEVRMRHVILEPRPDGLAVTEMISVFNPADRAWTGAAGGGNGGAGKPTTLAITLPAGATDVKAGSPPADVGTFADGRVVYAAAMVPGATDYQIRYVLPAKDDAAEVTLVAPAATGSLFVFLPDDGTTVTSAALKKVETKPGMKLRANSRFYTAAPQKAGERLSFTVSGLRAAKPAAAAPPRDDDGLATTGEPAAPPADASGIPEVAKMVATVGVATVLVTGVAYIVLKSPKAAGARP